MKANKDKNKKGDISATTIVTFVILLIGFGIVLMFVYRLHHSAGTERTVCKESVTLRATSLGITYQKADFVPLNCKTQKICITSGIIGGDCKDNFGDEKIVKVKVGNNPEKISKAVADEVLSCWDMMGQGRLDLLSEGLIQKFSLQEELAPSSCVICSRIAFDLDTLNKQGVDLSKVDVYDYMRRHKAPISEGNTYISYIASGSPAGISVETKEPETLLQDYQEDTKKIGDIQIKQASEIADLPNSGKSPEMAVIFMQVRGAESLTNIFMEDAAVLGGAVVVAGKIPFVGKIAEKVSAVVAKVAIIIGAVVTGKQVYTHLRNYEIAAGYCSDVTVGDDEGFGCSAVRVVPYDIESIKQYCNVIESIS